MFKRLTKHLVQELDSDGKMIPVSSLACSNDFRPLSLVAKEQSWWPWHTQKYSPIPFKLSDIFQQEAMAEIELKYSEPLLLSATMYHKAGAKLNLKIRSTEVTIGGLGTSCFSTSPIYVRKIYMDSRELWKIETSLDLIQQMYPKLQLYVVTEVFEIMEPLLIEKTVHGGGKGQVTAEAIFEIKGLGTRAQKNSVQIPGGTVVAYMVEKLHSPEEALNLLFKSVQRKSVSEFTYDAFQIELISSCTAIQQVKGIVKEAYEPLMHLNQTLRSRLLESVRVFLQDGDIAFVVKSVLELSLAGNTIDCFILDSLNEELQPPVEKLLSYLGIFQDTVRREKQALWEPVHFLCSSIDDLDYETLPLLETVLDKKKIAEQLEKMDEVLEWILACEERSVFTSPAPSLLDGEADLTIEILQTCGLDSEVQEDTITYLWNDEARSELVALYSSMYALQVLNG